MEQQEQTKKPDTNSKTLVNGVDINALSETMQFLDESPELAQFRFRADNRWNGGANSTTTIDDFTALGEIQHRESSHSVEADQPPLILGQDTAPNPVEALLGALGACISNTVAYHMAAKGLELDTFESKLEGKIDVRGFLNLDPNVREGFGEITLKVAAESPADKALLLELIEKSPVLDVVRNGTKVNIEF